MSPSAALVKRQNADVTLMPPPPTKRTKRPSVVLDEDDYTSALSDIIARDYFPGVAEAKAQEEYLTALESKNDAWIKEAGQRLREAVTPLPHGKTRNTSRDARFDTPRSWTNRTPVPDTPRGSDTLGRETPLPADGSKVVEESAAQLQVDTSTLSISSFQAKYTSEDNESFNTLLDKQNNNRRKKHGYLWSSDQRIPSDRLLTHRAQKTAALEAQSNHEALAKKHNEQALVPMTTGATASRPASVDSWKSKTPNNGLMFTPDGIEDTTGFQTVMEAKEAASKAGPKETVFANTRFPPSYILNDTDQSSIPPSSPSLNTTIIAARDAANPPSSSSVVTDFPSSTPRVNGYSFVDEDDSPPPPPSNEEITYRDLLAGQTSNEGPNPFQISQPRRREDLHHRLVAKDQQARKKRDSQHHQQQGGKGNGIGNMTPAARRLMDRLGRTPVRAQNSQTEGDGSGARDMWTPVATPRKKEMK